MDFEIPDEDFFRVEFFEFLDDDSIYSSDVREELLETDALTPHEVAFMEGYELDRLSDF